MLGATSSDQPVRMPGATLVTRLKVYDSTGPDGQRGGTPHVHLVCTEVYFVIAGSGAVELIDATGFRRVELGLHAALMIAPGTVHRLVNPHGDMELLIVMQNSGLPERGDNVVTFPSRWLESAPVFDDAMRAASVGGALLRRDRGVQGFMELHQAFAASPGIGRERLGEFYRRAVALKERQLPSWQTVIERGALAEAQSSLKRIEALRQGDPRHLFKAAHHAIAPAEYSGVGFCGRLHRYYGPANLMLEGIAERGPHGGT